MLPISLPKYFPIRSSFRQTLSSALGILVTVSTVIPGLAQQTVPATPDRITRAIDDNVLTTLRGNVHPLANAGSDLGAAPVSQRMNHMQLVLQRSPAQEAALGAFLSAVQQKNSPNYHKWLTPKQFGALYGPSDADIQKLSGWLEGEGFTVNKVANGRTFIDFSGSVDQVQRAFHTSIHNYQANGTGFYANVGNPQIPSALQAVVLGVFHFNNYPLKPQYVLGKPGRYDSSVRRIVPLSSSSRATPNLTQGDSTNGYFLFVTPGDAATIYDTPNSTFNANFSGGTSYDGSGVTIGVVGQSAIDPTIVANYRSVFVGDTKTPVISNLDGVGDVPGDDGESYLDNEISGGLAPGATIHFYTESATNGGIFGAAQYAIDTDNTVDILSVSYGSCEFFNTTGGNAATNSLWQQAATQGITVVVSTGDTGSAGCDDPGTSASPTPAALYGLQVNGLASTVYDIAVGGTDFEALALGNFGDYASTSSGAASTFYRTAKGYIPETTWNNSTFNNGDLKDNVPWDQTPYNVQDNIGAAGGGKSSCVTNTTVDNADGSITPGTCQNFYPKPPWQTGTGVPQDQARDIPDISLLAGNGFYGGLWAFCDNESGTDGSGNAVTLNCALENGTFNFNMNGVGGTSTGAPAFSGMMATVVQKTGQRQGAAAPVLYSLFNSSNGSSIFHDIVANGNYTGGNNSVPCQQTQYNTADCVPSNNTSGYLFESGYNTFTGYDLATGLGSVDATQLVNNWTSASGSLYVAEVTATPSATSITTAQPLTFTISVAALAGTGAGVPTGTVTASDGTTAGTSAATALSNGSATITFPANTLAANASDTFTISYAPPNTGATFANASTFVNVAITQGVTPAIAVSGTSITTTAGSPGSSTITVTPSGGFTGAVNLACTVTGPSGATSVPTCSFTPAMVTITGTTAATSMLNVATTSTTTTGAYTVTVKAADVATGKVTASTPLALTVNATATPGISLSGAAISIALPATTGSSTITVTPSGGFTGAVNLACVVTGPTGAVFVPTCAFSASSVTISGTTPATSTLNVTAFSTTTTGAYTVTVNAADAATGKVTKSDPIALAITGTSAPQTITMGTPTTATVSSPGQSATATIAITTNYSPATINFSCALATAPSGADTTYNPGCSVAAVKIAAGSTTGTATATFTTTAPSNGTLATPKTNQRPDNHWYTAAGGAALACMLFFGIPARRRSWKSMLSLLVFLVAMAGIGCGGGGGNNNNGNPGTTAGMYTFTVTGADSVTSTITASATVTVNVQ
jgi:hypothetical protein